MKDEKTGFTSDSLISIDLVKVCSSRVPFRSFLFAVYLRSH
jgi:hypothetical protein